MGTPGHPVGNIQSWQQNIIGNAHPSVVNAFRLMFDAIQDHDTAITGVDAKVTPLVKAAAATAAKASSTSSAASAAAATAATTAATTKVITSTFGNVNNQTATAYSVQPTDYASLVTFNNSSPTTVNLESSLARGWFGAMENLGSGTVTLTPSSGLVNGGASVPLPQSIGAWVFFDGDNWWAVTSSSAVGTITGVTAGTGLSGGGTSGAVTLSLITPVSVADGGTGTATPGLVAGTNVTITGSWPNQTINASGGSSGVTQIVAGMGVTVSPSGGTGVVTVNATPLGSILSGTCTITVSAGGGAVSGTGTIVGISSTSVLVASLQTPIPFSGGGSSGVLPYIIGATAYFVSGSSFAMFGTIPSPPSGTSYTAGSYTVNIRAIL